MKQYLKEISFLLGNDRQKLFGLLLLFLISSLLELVGIGLIGPYLSIARLTLSTMRRKVTYSETVE